MQCPPMPMREQQVNGVNYKETDIYSPTLKAAEGRLLMVIASANVHKSYKIGAKKALVLRYGDDVM